MACGDSILNDKQCRAIVRERAQNTCERCGTRCGPPSYHHRLKRSQGGKWEPENIVLVGGSGTTGCHGWVESHPQEADAEGFHVRPWENPATKPVHIRKRFWAVLTPEGTYALVPDN